MRNELEACSRISTENTSETDAEDFDAINVSLPYSTAKDQHQHRSRESIFDTPWNIMVSAILSPKEVRGNPEAEKAIIAEAAKLKKRIVWDEQSVEEWREVAERARRNGVTVHVGRVFAVVVVKNAELDPSDPLRKIKARLVFQGNEVRDQFGQIALYEQMSSSPATMQAAKCADAYGLAPNNDVQTADAVQAYPQSPFDGDPTYLVCRS